MLNSINGFKFNSKRLGSALVLAYCIPLMGCGSIAEKTNGLSDERILSEAGGTLGIAPSDLTMESRRVEGVNTYVTLKGKDGKTYACTINGGNLFSFGMTNPPVCNAR